MGEKKKIRALMAEEIEVRVSQVTEKGVSLVLYKDARCDKRILDETYGVEGWANCYSEIKGNLYCSIMIHDKDTGMWIQKQDCGVESNTEKEKGEASDAFKRAGFNVGIGRELYTKIFIFIQVPTKARIKKVNGKEEPVIVNGKKVYDLENPYEKWHVASIRTNEETEKIEYLQIANSKDVVVFTYDKRPKEKKTTNNKTEQKEITEEAPKLITNEQRKKLFAISNHNQEVVKMVLERYGYEKTQQIKEDDYEKICTEIEAELLM